jgi:hypothetical protein
MIMNNIPSIENQSSQKNIVTQLTRIEKKIQSRLRSQSGWPLPVAREAQLQIVLTRISDLKVGITSRKINTPSEVLTIRHEISELCLHISNALDALRWPNELSHQFDTIETLIEPLSKT